MKPKLDTVVVDYGLGNLFSVEQALAHCGAAVTTSSDPDVVAGADRLVLPGVGAFADGMQRLSQKSLTAAILEFAAGGSPLLGICLGMQVLFDESEEFGRHEGLHLIAGKVEAIPARKPDGTPRRIPHVGWSPLLPSPAGKPWAGTLLERTPPGASVYFLHSYATHPTDPLHQLAVAEYDGIRICAVVQRENIVGCQFHPEKSGPVGLAILSRFLSA